MVWLKINNKEMSELLKMIHEQLNDYSSQLKATEKEIIRKYKSGEDFSQELTKASGLKLMQKECLLMMTEKR